MESSRKLTLLREEIPQDGLWIVRVIMAAGFADSRKEARQLISRGMIKLNGERAEISGVIDALPPEPFVLEYLDREKVEIRIAADGG